MPEVLLEWNDSMSVGVKALDDDHKKIISIINSLYASLRHRMAEGLLSDIFVELFRYISEHDAREEGLLQQTNYPGCVDHEKEHAARHVELESVFSRYLTQEDGFLAIDVLTMLCHWFLKHIQRTDMLYKEHLNVHGIR